MQVQRLRAYLSKDIAPADDLSDCTDALNYLREYTYRKIFTGTSHWDFVQLDAKEPEVIDWLLAIHEVESSNFQQRKHR